MPDIRLTTKDYRAFRAAVFVLAAVCGVTAINLLFAWSGHVDGSAVGLLGTVVFKFGLALVFCALTFIVPVGAAIERAERGPSVLDPGGLAPVGPLSLRLPRSAIVAGLRRPPRFFS